MSANREKKILNRITSGLASKVNFFDRRRNETKDGKKDENLLSKKMGNLNINKEWISTKMSHLKFLESCFDYVKDENELRGKHEENMKIVIENFKANPNKTVHNEAELENLIKDIDEDFQTLLIKYRSGKKDIEHKVSNLEYTKALENAKEYYVREMNKHFVEAKHILIKELQDLHEKYKSLAQHKLKEELPQINVNQLITEQLNQTLEIIYNQYKKQNLTNKSAIQVIGIDLGTTYCCVGVMKRGKVHILLNESGFNTTPSYVTFGEIGEKSLIGSLAKEDSFSNPVNTIYDAKRMIGRKYNDEQIQNDMKLWPFEVVNVNDSLKIQLYNTEKTTLYPEEVSAEILIKLKKDAEDFLGYEVKNAVITVPAYFNDAQRQATKHAGHLAGLNVLQILNEPTAAAIAYSHQIKDDVCRNILVYDLGGGTFDVAVVVIDKGNIDVRAVGGDTHLGGEDFDQRILDYFYKKYEKNFAFSGRQALKRALARLKIQCEQKKWILSNVGSATFSIDVLLHGWDFKETLKRTEFEFICMDLFKKTISIVDETLKSAKINKSDINEIVLIGGSTKIPKIQSLLKEYFDGKPLNKEINPDEAVAYGATIQAALLNGEEFSDSFSVVTHDVTPFSLGIELKDKSMAVIIPRNSKLPTERTQRFLTSKDNQSHVFIQIFEGENIRETKENRLLGTFTIDGLPMKPKGQEYVDVTIRINEEGILNVTGKTSVKSTHLAIKDYRGRISPVELEALRSQVCKLIFKKNLA